MFKTTKSFRDNSIMFFLFTIVLITNAQIIVLLYAFSMNFLLELYKFSQIALLVVAVGSLLRKISGALAFAAVFALYASYLALSEYRIITGSAPDFGFLKENLGNLPFMSLSYSLPLFMIAVLGALNALFFYKIKIKRKRAVVAALILAAIGLFPQPARRQIFDNELVAFAKSAYDDDKTINYYQDYYDALIRKSANEKQKILALARRIDREKLPAYLDNIIFLQLESVNKLLVNEKVTPTFVKLAKQGIFLPNFYGNGVMTIYGQENILCSMPNSFRLNLVKSGADERILCLPEIMNNLGYKTFFLKSYDLRFAQTGKFMKNLRFNEVLAEKIMRPGDPKLPWGYREDVFYERAFEYLKNNKTKNNFIYVEVGPTNHWPFDGGGRTAEKMIYENPKNHKEKITNTTHLQDKYLAIAWKKINELFPAKNYTLFILSDHSWPLGERKRAGIFGAPNIFNQRGSYEENFLSSMAVIFGDRTNAGKTIARKHSNMDIMPTVLDLFGIAYQNNKFGGSFAKELFGNETNENDILLIQPYEKQYINVVRGGKKYQYNAYDKIFVLYDLKNDKTEKRGLVIGDSEEENLKILNNLLGS